MATTKTAASKGGSGGRVTVQDTAGHAAKEVSRSIWDLSSSSEEEESTAAKDGVGARREKNGLKRKAGTIEEEGRAAKKVVSPNGASKDSVRRDKE